MGTRRKKSKGKINSSVAPHKCERKKVGAQNISIELYFSCVKYHNYEPINHVVPNKP